MTRMEPTRAELRESFRELFEATEVLTEQREGSVPVYWAVMFADEYEFGWSEIEAENLSEYGFTNKPYELGCKLAYLLCEKNKLVCRSRLGDWIIVYAAALLGVVLGKLL